LIRNEAPIFFPIHPRSGQAGIGGVDGVDPFAFRTNLPIRPTLHEACAAADGQLGGIMKVDGGWRISGDTAAAVRAIRLIDVHELRHGNWQPS